MNQGAAWSWSTHRHQHGIKNELAMNGATWGDQGKPVVLFDQQYEAVEFPAVGRAYDVSPDGRRFLMVKAADPSLTQTQINVVLNWLEEDGAIFRPLLPSQPHAAPALDQCERGTPAARLSQFRFAVAPQPF
jgi:hypothetical protein